jgi:LacI family transcriptional regulator
MPALKKSIPAVALLIETSNAYARGLLEGINRYLVEHGPWSIYLPERSRGEGVPHWKVDGVLARIESRSWANLLDRLKVPTINLSKPPFATRFPCIETDDAAIAKEAFEHFAERGFHHFAYCPEEEFVWSRLRGEAFVRCAKEAKADVSMYERPKGASHRWSYEQQQDHLGAWLRDLPKPVGLMAAYDIRGRQVLDACRRVNAAVPDEVAVIGVDNDELLCTLSHPSLSSVIPNPQQIGYEAATLLGKALEGMKLKRETHYVGPSGIATRQSTDVLAITDESVARAVRFIREHACEGIKVDDILKEVPMARRSLERRFHDLLGRSIHSEIARLQLDRAKTLLRDTSLTLDQIAEKAGFHHPEYLSAVFKKQLGTTPGKFRKGEAK